MQRAHVIDYKHRLTTIASKIVRLSPVHAVAVVDKAVLCSVALLKVLGLAVARGSVNPDDKLGVSRKSGKLELAGVQKVLLEEFCSPVHPKHGCGALIPGPLGPTRLNRGFQLLDIRAVPLLRNAMLNKGHAKSLAVLFVNKKVLKATNMVRPRHVPVNSMV